MREILTFCEADRPWLADTIQALVLAESPSDNKDAVDACGRVLQARLEQCGARTTRIAKAKCGDQLRAEWGPPSRSFGGAGTGERQVLLLGHFDTVWPVGQLAAMPVHQCDGKLHGPGIFDMKSGVALGMQAMRALRTTAQMPPLRVVMVLTTDEETGSEQSRALLEVEARRSSAVLVLEPALPGGALKTGRKGCGTYRVIVRGKAAHAGIDPAQGANAIHELALQIERVHRLQDATRGVTVNVGVISGGTRPNVVPELATAIVDVRVPTMEAAAALDASLRGLTSQLPGTSLEIEGGVERPPLERTEAVVRLYQKAREIAAELGHGLAEGSTGGGSDGNFTAALGIPTLDGLGATGDGAHALHEHVIIADLPWRAALIAGLITRLS